MDSLLFFLLSVLLLMLVCLADGAVCCEMLVRELLLSRPDIELMISITDSVLSLENREILPYKFEKKRNITSDTSCLSASIIGVNDGC